MIVPALPPRPTAKQESVSPQNQPSMSHEPGLSPDDVLGQKFLEYFHHPWHFIHAPTPLAGERPQWTTETRYPLQPRNLWSLYQNPDILLGLRFGTETNYFLLDVDSGSTYHSTNDAENFNTVLATMEGIGLCRPVIIQSSPSGGIHVYYFFNEKHNSFDLATAVFLALVQKGIIIKDGQLELFPNPKSYGKDKPTDFKAHRLPLQAGSYLLDASLQPESNDLEDFFDAAAWSANGQDDAALHQAIADAKTQRKRLFSKGQISRSAASWKRHLEERIQQGWTDFHQTNELLKDIACYGIVFRRLQGEQLVDYVEATAVAAPGYQQWCRHQHEIRKRATERARNCENFYTPYPSVPNRLLTYRQQFGNANNVVPFSPNQERHQKTLDRIAAVVSTLKERQQFPTTISLRAKAIIEASKNEYGIGVSKTTLNKPDYLLLWHPDHEAVIPGSGVRLPQQPDSTTFSPEKYPQLPDPWFEGDEPLTQAQQAVHPVYTLPPYMKVFCLPQASAIGDLKSIPTDKQNKSSSKNGSALSDDKLALSITQKLPSTVSPDDSGADSKIDSSQTVPPSTPNSVPPSTPLSIQSDRDRAETPRKDGEIFSNLFLLDVLSRPPSPLPNNQETASDGTGVTPDEHRHATRLRLQARRKARKWVKSYSFTHFQQLTPLERQEIEDLALRILLAQAGSLLLVWETREWFVVNFDRLSKRGLGWIGIHLYPDLFG